MLPGVAVGAIRSIAARRWTAGISASGLAGGIGLAALVIAIAAALARTSPDSARSRMDSCAAGWIAGAALFHAALGDEPPRYYLGLAFPAALLAAALIAEPGAAIAWIARAVRGD